MSSAAESVRGFTEFDYLCRGNKGYSDNLAQLFDVCEKDKTHRHKISSKQALKRLRNKIKDTLNSIENESSRKVTEFTIGKTFVMELNPKTFDPMKRTTWKLGDGINSRWQDYEERGYDGLVVIGCVVRDLIPDDVMPDKRPIKMDQQKYAVGLEQSLIQYYTLYKPDPRLGNGSFHPGKEPKKKANRGGVVYVAYKLEQETNLDNLTDDNDDEPTKEIVNSVQIQRAFERLRFELEKIGLNFDQNISLENSSFFKACCNQLKKVGIPERDQTCLREMLVGEMKNISRDIILLKNYTNDTWNEYLDRLANDEEHVCDLVVESMARILDREIVIYDMSYLTGLERISINIQAEKNGPPLLFAREKPYYKSLIETAGKQQKRTAEHKAKDSTEIDEVNIGLSQLQLDRLSDQDSTSDVKTSKAQKIN